MTSREYEQMSDKDRDEFEKVRKSRLEGFFSTIKQRLIFFSTPDVLLQKDEYKKRPEWRGWLTVVLESLQDAQYLVSLGDEFRGTANEEKVILNNILKNAHECTERNLTWVREQLHREFKEDLVNYYYPTDWVEMLDAEFANHEEWYVCNNRDEIEAHLNAPQLLHPALIPDPKLVKLVKKADAVLRVHMPKFWSQFYATMPQDVDAHDDKKLDTREIYCPRSHWWWYLDEGI
jgi:hypothetical protein